MDLGPNIVRNSYQYLLVQSGANAIKLGNNGTVNWVAGGVVDSASTQTIGGSKTFSSLIGGSINGNAATVTDGVYATGNQTISGVKTFATGIITPNVVYNTGNQTISGVKTFATGIVAPNVVYNTGNQTISGTKTFISTISANINGNAGSVNNGVYIVNDQSINGTKTFTSPNGIIVQSGISNSGNYVLARTDGTYTTTYIIQGLLAIDPVDVVYTLTVPSGDGTFALTSEIPNLSLSNYFGEQAGSPNYFGSYATTNYFGDYVTEYNYFGQFSTGNSFGDSAVSNAFGSAAQSNTFGYDATYNVFGEGAVENVYSAGTFGDTARTSTYQGISIFTETGRMRLANFTGASNQTGLRGEARVSGAFLYICTGATSGWGRIPISGF